MFQTPGILSGDGHGTHLCSGVDFRDGVGGHDPSRLGHSQLPNDTAKEGGES
nr:MAG TPA: hypothetical protein [Caudoviricetes sp.]